MINFYDLEFIARVSNEKVENLFSLEGQLSTEY